MEVIGRAVSLGISLAALLSGSSWVRVIDPPFEILSSAGARNAEEAHALLTGVRHLFATQVGAEPLARIPVRVYLFESESEFNRYRLHPQAAGFHIPGMSRDIVAAVAGSQRVLLHEYTHVVVRHAGLRLPWWLSEGTAELYSTVPAGAAIGAHMQTLARGRWQGLADLFEGEDDHGPARTSFRYAQSWAFVHMLNFSPRRRGDLAALVEALQRGTNSAEALEAVYGTNLAALQAELRTYIRTLASREQPQSLSLRTHKRAEPTTDVDARLALLELARAVPREEQAEDLLASLRSDYPNHPGVLNALGDNADDPVKALALYRQAIDAGDHSGRLRYDIAVVLRDRGKPSSEVEPWLREAVMREPDLFDAHVLLGNLLIEAGRDEEAAESLRAAAALQPLNGTVQEQLALSLHRLGRNDSARVAAGRARMLAASEQAAARADALLEATAAKRAQRRSVVQPPGLTAQAEGQLVQVDCLGAIARLHVRREQGGKTLLLVRDAAAVNLDGTRARELPCGDVRPPWSIEVRFRPYPDPSYGTTGDVLSISRK